MTKEITIERCVQQIQHGSHYKGYVKIGATQFDYEIIFGVPFAEINEIEPSVDDDSEFRKIFQITLKRSDNNEPIVLTTQEYNYFVLLIVDIVYNFYHSKNSRTFNGEGYMASLGSTVSIGMTVSNSYNFAPELCTLLNAPKFGCSL